MTCNICNKREAKYFGRWIAWCSQCRDKGSERDRELVINNELAPDIESVDFQYTLDHGLGDYLI